MTTAKEDIFDLTASIIKRRENILMLNQQREKLKRREVRWTRLLIASLVGLALCGVVLYVQSHPKAPIYSHEDRQALDELVRSLQ